MAYIKLFCVAAVIFIMAAKVSIAQDTLVKTDSLRKNALNVYFNCPDCNMGYIFDCPNCDMDYIKNEITFINYVRDQKDAQLYILVTFMNTGSGGTEYSVYFIGQKEFIGQNDTLKFSTSPDDTEDKIRAMGNQMLKLGLISYVAKTPLAKDISISYGRYEETNPGEVQDTWKNWVFNIYSYCYFSGEESIKYFYNYSNIDATKVTEKKRIDFYADYSLNQTKYKLTEPDTTIISLSNSKSISALYVGSLGDHWSAGGSANVYASTYSNINHSFGIDPALEYNLFKYAESTRRQLRFKYSIGAEYNKYIDTTIFDKTTELLYSHSLGIAYKVIETWGSVSTTLSGSNYLHDFSKNRLSLYTNLSVRLFKGLSVDIQGQVQLIRNQLYLSKAGATPEEILTQQKQLATQYSYYGSVGLTYTFGSIYNNVVNPRFGY
jgi:hypothetical protein